MKIIIKKYWQDMKNFVEKISIKIEGFYLINMNLVQTLQYKHTKISVEIRILTEIPKGQKSANNIGGPIYRSISSLKLSCI